MVESVVLELRGGTEEIKSLLVASVGTSLLVASVGTSWVLINVVPHRIADIETERDVGHKTGNHNVQTDHEECVLKRTHESWLVGGTVNHHISVITVSSIMYSKSARAVSSSHET